MKKYLNQFLPKLYGSYYNLLVQVAPKKTAQKVFDLFCKVRKGRVNQRQAAFLDPAIYKKIAAADHQIQTYLWQGSGPTVVLVHGWESNSYRWRNLIAGLQDANFNVIAFDAPGHGYSDGNKLYVPLYAEVLQEVILRFKPQHLVGHSVGGMTLIYNEHKYRNTEVQKLVTIAAPSEFYEIMGFYQKLLGFNSKVYWQMNTYLQNRFGFTIKEFSSAAFVKNNTKKGFVLHDRFDKITPFKDSEMVHANWDNSKFMATEGLGHSMHQNKVNKAIITFLQKSDEVLV